MKKILLFGAGKSATSLIRYLLDPGCVPPVERASYSPRLGGPTLLGNQPAAVAGAIQERGLFLIQGPPGTGKTSVLVEIIHAYL